MFVYIYRRLRSAAERAKRMLSTTTQTTIEIGQLLSSFLLVYTYSLYMYIYMNRYTNTYIYRPYLYYYLY